MYRIKLLLSFLIVFLSLYEGMTQEFPEPMSPPRLVNDYAGMLSEQENNLLEEKLRGYNDTTSTEISIVIIQSTGPYDIGQYAAELGQKWGIGKTGKENGLLILVALKDRDIWVATGYGLEPTITDAASKRVIENYIKPNFKQQQYFKGLDEATSIFMGLASGEFTADETQSKGDGAKAIGMIFLFLLFMVGIPYMRYRSMKRHHFGGRNNMSFLTAMLLMGSMGGGRGSSFNDFSGGGGAFGGGGFGGFGGGSFGGGGAGGSW